MPTLTLEPLTQKQEQIVATIERSRLLKGLTPTYREIADSLGQQPSSLLATINRICAKGYLGRIEGARDRVLEVKVPVLAPRYIGALSLVDGSLTMGSPKAIPHHTLWEGCVGVELLQGSPERKLVAGDILILRAVQGYTGQSLNQLHSWESHPERLTFDLAPGKALFYVVGTWRAIDP